MPTARLVVHRHVSWKCRENFPMAWSLSAEEKESSFSEEKEAKRLLLSRSSTFCGKNFTHVQLHQE
jgi:hypothetical protein